jgi:single-stranded DNA-specific DHH superfamily exonuclease
MKSKADIASALINRISSKRENCTIVIAQQNSSGMIGLHARRQDRKIAVNELLEKAVKGLKNASAGGHVPAAGGKIQAKDLEKFRKKVLKILENKICFTALASEKVLAKDWLSEKEGKAWKKLGLMN